MFGKLFVKEIKGYILIPMIMVLALILAWDLFLRSRMGIWPSDVILGLTFVVTIIPLIWSVAMAFYTLNAEWNSNTIYLLLSLPASSLKTIGAKTLAIFSGVVAIIIFSVSSYFLVFQDLIQGYSHFYTNAGFTMSTLYWAGGTLLLFSILSIVICQFSFLVGRLVPKGRGITTCIALLASIKLSGKIFDLLSPLLKWVPEIENRLSTCNIRTHSISITSSGSTNITFLIIILLLSGLFFILSGVIFEKRIEL